MNENDSTNSKKYIEFEELNKYILKPVYNNQQKRWKILKGYAKIEDNRRVMYTETDSMREANGWEEFEDTLLSDYEREI